MSEFGDAFAAARKEQGAGGTFTHNGKSYSTNVAGETGSNSSNSGGSSIKDSITGFATGLKDSVTSGVSSIANDLSLGWQRITKGDERFLAEGGEEAAAFIKQTNETIQNNKANTSGGSSNSSNSNSAANGAADDTAAAEDAVIIPEVSIADQILQMATDAGVDLSNELITSITTDPEKFLDDRGMSLSDLTPTLDADAAGTTLDGTDEKYDLGDDLTVTATTVDDIASADNVTQADTSKYTAETSADQLGTDATTVDAATGTIGQDNLVTAEEIDMTGAATGINADGTVSVTGEALNDFATQNISNIIDTSTVAGKLLANKLGEGNYTDSKATVIGQMKIISEEFKDSNGNPVIPPWAQKISRDISKSMNFQGITGTAATAAMSTAIMEATLGVADKEAAFFQTLTTKNLDNRQQAIINKATVLSKFEVANLDNRQAAAVQNAKSFLEMDLKNLTNEQQAEVVNTQAMVDAIFNDQTAVNAARLFGAEADNDMAKYYDNMNAQIDIHRAEQTNSMKKFNAGEQNDAAEFNAKMENSRDEFYATMQYNLDLANAKWRQTVETTNTKMEFDAAEADVKNMVDISTEAMTRMWDRVDSNLDYIFKFTDSEANRDANVLMTTITAQAGQKSGGNPFLEGIFTLGAAYITSMSDKRLKLNIEYQDTIKGLKYYTWDWNDEAKRIGADRYPTVGVLAQQVQRKYPEAVVEGPDGYLMVNYGKLQ